MEEQEDIVSKAMSAMAAERAATADARDFEGPDLQATGLEKIYGDRRVVNGMDVSCRCGEIVGLLGPNGAGKTTTFYMVVGLVRPDGGRVVFRGEDVTGLPVYQRARRGIGYLAQEASVFRKLSVWDNVMAILETVPMSNPAILMLDEPFAGVDPLSVNEIQDIVRRLAKKGLGIIITDHNVRETLSVVDRAYMVYEGRLLKEGTSAELVRDEEVRRRYLGDDFRM